MNRKGERRSNGLSLFLLSICLIISACEGGGGGGSSSPFTPPAAQSISGIWIGTFISNVTYRTESVTGLIAETGSARFASTSTLAQYNGGISVSGNSFSATVTAYAPLGYVFPDGSQVGSVSMSGIFTAKNAMSGTYSGVGDFGTFSLTYSGLYERPSSLAALVGNWTGIVSGSTNTLTIMIDPSGNMSGSSTLGCNYSGNIGIIDSSYNAYSVNLNINNCGLESGNYSGLAALTDISAAANDTLLVEVSSPSFSFVAALMRTPAPAPAPAPTLNITVLQPMNESRADFAAAMSGEIYVFGGEGNNNSIFSSVESYNLNTGKWTYRHAMPGPKNRHRAATSSDGKIYLFGGSSDGTPSTDVWAYEPATDSWDTSIAKMPAEERDTVAVTGANGIIYLFGGYWNYNTVQAFDPPTKTWQIKTPMPTGRWGAAGALGPDGKIYIVGGGYPGQAYGKAYNTLEVYDPSKDSWAIKSPMPTARVYLGAAFGGDGKLYAIGGEVFAGITYDVIEAYDPLADAWESVGNLPLPLNALSAVTDNIGYIHSLGGNSPTYGDENLHYLLQVPSQ